MPRPIDRRLRALFAAAATLLAVAAIYHVYRLFVPDTSSSFRHALFVAVDGLLAAGFVYRPRWFAWLFALVVAQQLVSHGGAALDTAQQGRTDFVSIAVLVGLPAMLFLLIAEQRATRRSGGTH